MRIEFEAKYDGVEGAWDLGLEGVLLCSEELDNLFHDINYKRALFVTVASEPFEESYKIINIEPGRKSLYVGIELSCGGKDSIMVLVSMLYLLRNLPDQFYFGVSQED